MMMKKPYSVVASGNEYDGDEFVIDDDDDDFVNREKGSQVVVTTNIVDDDDDDDDWSNGPVSRVPPTQQRNNCHRFVLLTCFLVALVFGCRIAYFKLVNGGSVSVDSSTNDAAMNSEWEMDDDKYNSVEYEEKGDDVNEFVFDDDSNDFNIADDSLLEGTWEGESVDIKNDDEGKEIHEEYLDDEINNHEVGGEFDSDMNYNNDDEDSGEDEQVDKENYLEEGEEEIDYENEENDLVENQDDEVEKEQGEGLDGEDVGEGLTFDVKNDEHTNSVPPDEIVDDIDAIDDEGKDAVTDGEMIAIEEDEDPMNNINEEAAIIPPHDELPDYFVPLTPVERMSMKERLRATLRTTKSALLMSGNRYPTNPTPQRTLVLDYDSPKQFMHMHHMKTGGTSVDGLIRCALNRQKELHNGTAIPYYSMSECGSGVKDCMAQLASKLNASVVDNVFYQNDEQGHVRAEIQFSFDPADAIFDNHIDDMNVCRTSESNVMSYCASLHSVRTFGWKDVDKITIIRDPVDRAWSMYRFTLDRCYKCQELKDVLRQVENGTFESRYRPNTTETNFVYSPNDSCAVQMIGHQATNLLSSVELYNVASDVRFPKEKEIVEEAVRNLREQFTWIGLTDRLDESIAAMRDVFPFLAVNLSEAAMSYNDLLQKSGNQVDDIRFSLPEGYNDSDGCPLPHSNGGREPHCGTTKLDDETIYWIKKLNSRDVAVYKAAVERFTLQMEVLGEYRDGSL